MTFYMELWRNPPALKNTHLITILPLIFHNLLDSSDPSPSERVKLKLFLLGCRYKLHIVKDFCIFV